MKPVISVENVSKKFSRNADAHRRYGLSDLMREVFGRAQTAHLRPDEFYAVRGISLRLDQGDTLGLIGRNGAGKSTLLKLMVGLTKPDEGRIVLRGKMQALINLGAGFNMALSGRQNIYAAAALHGRKGREMRALADEVIGFSELEDFIESPVYTYSSGMKARLGFAVAISCNPDILLVDEILAVGDYAFRNRCATRIQELKKQGVTIVLVSHAHNEVIQLCDRALWVHQGNAMKIGASAEVVNEYLGFLELEEAERLRKEEKIRAQAPAKAREMSAKPQAATDTTDGLYGPIFPEFDKIEDLEFALEVDGEDATQIVLHSPVTLEYSFALRQPVEDLNITLKLFHKDGLNLTTISTLNGDLVRHIHGGRVHCACHIPDFDFNPGVYALVMAIHEGRSYLYRNVVRFFAVIGDGRLNWGMRDFKYKYEVFNDESR